MNNREILRNTIFGCCTRNAHAFIPQNEGFDMMNIINKIALILVIIGALNWGLIGLFSFDLVAWISGGAATVLARIIYTIVAIAGIWSISMLFMNTDELSEHRA